METTGRVKALLDEQKCDVSRFTAGAKTGLRTEDGEDGFVDKRAAAWWGMREMLNPANGMNVALPPDDELTGDLTAPRWWVTSGARIRVESKDELRKPDRLGRSTDCADAVIMAFWWERHRVAQKRVALPEHKVGKW